MPTPTRWLFMAGCLTSVDCGVTTFRHILSLRFTRSHPHLQGILATTSLRSPAFCTDIRVSHGNPRSISISISTMVGSPTQPNRQKRLSRVHTSSPTIQTKAPRLRSAQYVVDYGREYQDPSTVILHTVYVTVPYS
jgi:hypothetical protein